MLGQCPMGIDSLCKYQSAIANGVKYQDKSKRLPKNIMNIVKPMYIKLCDPELLKQCLDGKFQNANEALNGLSWKHSERKVCGIVNSDIGCKYGGYTI
ncbi:hypothetical protein AVEN_83129-1 [Araneus ventricosus]|uniref:Uncharacterized protein n=1 Tax=Araneus ventricosus TaxID=182803 RepID=A0A4Y2AMJ8_ARAVE|nr:hypothetical protein AVEN_83129-1 [Araneus ventricosus]